MCVPYLSKKNRALRGLPKTRIQIALRLIPERTNCSSQLLKDAKETGPPVV
jgi:hypothetical protein